MSRRGTMCDIKRPHFLLGFASSTCSERLACKKYESNAAFSTYGDIDVIGVCFGFAARCIIFLLRFTVLVFYQSMREKEAALKAENHRDINKNGGRVVKKKDRDISALPDSIVEGVPKRARCSEILSECAYKIHLDSTNIGDDNGGTQEAGQNNKLNNAVTVAVSPCAAVQMTTRVIFPSGSCWIFICMFAL